MRGKIVLLIADGVRIQATPSRPNDLQDLCRLAGAIAAALEAEIQRIAAERFAPRLWPERGRPDGGGAR